MKPSFPNSFQKNHLTRTFSIEKHLSPDVKILIYDECMRDICVLTQERKTYLH